MHTMPYSGEAFYNASQGHLQAGASLVEDAHGGCFTDTSYHKFLVMQLPATAGCAQIVNAELNMCRGALQPDGEQTTSWVLHCYLQQH